MQQTIEKLCNELINEVSDFIDDFRNEDDVRTNYWTGKTWDRFFGEICDFLRDK